MGGTGGRGRGGEGEGGKREVVWKPDMVYFFLNWSGGNERRREGVVLARSGEREEKKKGGVFFVRRWMDGSDGWICLNLLNGME